MPDITMEDFIDECLENRKPKKKKKVIEDKSVNISSIFEADKSVVDTNKAKEKEEEDSLSPEKEKTQEEDTILKMVLHINEEKKLKRFNKEEFADNLPLNFQAILKQFGYDLDQITKKVQEPTELEQPAEAPEKIEEKPEFNKFKLIVKELITSGAGNEKVELTWRRDGEGESAIETAEVVTANGSMPFNDSPDPLNSAISTFDRIYYNDIIARIREELDDEESSE